MKENLTSIVVVLDCSGSMHPLMDDTISGFNSFLAKQKEEPGEALFTLATFSDSCQLVHDSVPIAQVPELNKKTYTPGGFTALCDAVATTINNVGTKLSVMKEEDRPSKVLFLIMSDGNENSSKEFTHAKLMSMVNHQKDKYSWNFIFIGANIDSIAVSASIGINANSTYSYIASAAGTKALYSAISSGTSSYRSDKKGLSYSMPDPTLVVDNLVKNTSVVNGVIISPILNIPVDNVVLDNSKK